MEYIEVVLRKLRTLNTTLALLTLFLSFSSAEGITPLPEELFLQEDSSLLFPPFLEEDEILLKLSISSPEKKPEFEGEQTVALHENGTVTLSFETLPERKKEFLGTLLVQIVTNQGIKESRQPIRIVTLSPTSSLMYKVLHLIQAHKLRSLGLGVSLIIGLLFLLYYKLKRKTSRGENSAEKFRFR